MPDIVIQEQLPLAQPTIATMLDGAFKSGRTAAELKELLDVYERVECKNSERQFNAALTALQTEAKTIAKNRQVDFVSTKGGRVRYGFTDLESLLDQIRPLLDKHGFAFSHDTKVDDKQVMTVTCTLRHTGGHRESSSFSCPTTAQTTLMSDQQRYAAALTFARRYTLIQILGLATGDPDPDEIADPATITAEQAIDLNDALIDCGADIEAFKRYMGVVALADIRVSDIGKAQQAIEKKRKAVQK